MCFMLPASSWDAGPARIAWASCESARQDRPLLIPAVVNNATCNCDMAEDVLLPCFFYGTLMFDSVYLRVVSQGAVKVTEVPRSQKAVLRGYRRCCVRDRKYPALIVDRANANPRSVEGVLRWVPESHMFWLDDWEEVEYERRTVVVDVSGSDPIEAITYVWILDDSVELLPDDWSAQTFETEHLPGWIADADANGKLDWLGFELDGSASSAAAPE